MYSSIQTELGPQQGGEASEDHRGTKLRQIGKVSKQALLLPPFKLISKKKDNENIH